MTLDQKSSLNDKRDVRQGNFFQFFKVESHHEVKIVKFVRKNDGLEIDEDEILTELIRSKDECLLIALQLDEEYGIFTEFTFFLAE